MPIQLTQYAPSFRDLSRGFLARGAESLIRATRMNARIQQIEALQSKSDSALERLGMTREDIPLHVVRGRARIQARCTSGGQAAVFVPQSPPDHAPHARS